MKPHAVSSRDLCICRRCLNHPIVSIPRVPLVRFFLSHAEVIKKEISWINLFVSYSEGDAPLIAPFRLLGHAIECTYRHTTKGTKGYGCSESQTAALHMLILVLQVLASFCLPLSQCAEFVSAGCVTLVIGSNNFQKLLLLLLDTGLRDTIRVNIIFFMLAVWIKVQIHKFVISWKMLSSTLL